MNRKGRQMPPAHAQEAWVTGQKHMALQSTPWLEHCIAMRYTQNPHPRLLPTLFIPLLPHTQSVWEQR